MSISKGSKPPSVFSTPPNFLSLCDCSFLSNFFLLAVVLNPFNIEEAIAAMSKEALSYLLSARHKKILTIGGDHTISLPLLRACHQVHGPIALVHFDSHLDTWDTYFDSRYELQISFLHEQMKHLLRCRFDWNSELWV